MTDMAGYAARVAVERSERYRDTNNEDVIWNRVSKLELRIKN